MRHTKEGNIRIDTCSMEELKMLCDDATLKDNGLVVEPVPKAMPRLVITGTGTEASNGPTGAIMDAIYTKNLKMKMSLKTK